MRQNIFSKEYIALLTGNLETNKGIINEPIARKEGSIIEREINKNGDHAITYFEKINQYENYCLVKFKLETGRTHQIRVHSKFMGHPILGDTLYGISSPLIARQALHAYRVKFTHPITKKKLIVESKIPNDMANLINR